MTVAYEADQLVLLGEPRARRQDPDTSRDAARAVTQHAGRLENSILVEFCIRDGLTDEQLCERMPDYYGPTVKTCRSRLRKRGLLVAAGVVKNSRGRDMTQWKLARDER